MMMILLFFAALIAGFIDSIAGGGGLISLPALIHIGLPLPVALGTNKFQSSIGSLTATLQYSRSGWIEWKNLKLGIFFSFLGASCGTLLVQNTNTAILQHIIPFLLLFVGVFVAFSPQMNDQDIPPKLPLQLAFILIGFVMGFYDGFFGPGTGNFLTLFLVILCGYGLPKATAHTKVLNFTSNLTALSLFLMKGQIAIWPALVMALGQFVGAQLGSHIVIKRGSLVIKPIFIAVVATLAVTLLYKNYF